MKFFAMLAILSVGFMAEARSMYPYKHLSCYAAKTPAGGPVRGYYIKLKLNIFDKTGEGRLFPNCPVCMIKPYDFTVTTSRHENVETVVSNDGELKMKVYFEPSLPTRSFPAEVKSSHVNGGRLTPATCNIETIYPRRPM